MHASQSLQVDLGAAQRELEDEKSRGGVRMRELEEKIRDGIYFEQNHEHLLCSKSIIFLLTCKVPLWVAIWGVEVKFLSHVPQIRQSDINGGKQCTLYK